MSIGIYLRCDASTCRNELRVDATNSALPDGWLQGVLKPEAWNDAAVLHFCSALCAYLHDARVQQEERVDTTAVADDEAVAS